MTTTRSEHSANSRRIRLTIDISPELRRRIRNAAAQRDLSLRAYVERILEEAVTEDGASGQPMRRPLNREAVERLHRRREAISKGQVFPDSTEDIRQMRVERAEYLGNL